MSLIATPQETKQQKLILVLIVVVLVVVIIVYFGFFWSASVVVPIVEPIGTTTSIENTGTIGEDLHFLEDPRFQDLRKYGAWPIETGKTGRENPFNLPTGSTPPAEKVPEKSIEENSGETTSTVENLTIEDLMKLLEESAGTEAE